MTELEQQLMIIDEDSIKDLIYEIRGVKVMLDFDLARIYGYETKNFNRQIKNNIDRFPHDFMFQLTKEEAVKFLWCKNFTLNKTGDSRGQHFKYLPYAFTERGIYCLMTVLKGELAIKQTIALIRLFDEMKSYFMYHGPYLLTNTNSYIESRLSEHDKRFDKIEDKLDIVMKTFEDPKKLKKYIFVNNQRVEASLFFKDLYSKAKESIIIVDNYISDKTLEHLKVSNNNVTIYIFSDNQTKPEEKITEKDLEDFRLDTGRVIKIGRTNNILHDRYFIIDYKKDGELFFTSGPSEKDVGNKIGSLYANDDSYAYYPIIDKLLS